MVRKSKLPLAKMLFAYMCLASLLGMAADNIHNYLLAYTNNYTLRINMNAAGEAHVEFLLLLFNTFVAFPVVLWHFVWKGWSRYVAE